MTSRGLVHWMFALTVLALGCGSDEDAEVAENGDTGGLSMVTGGATGIPLTCGDGQVQAGEDCDDGNEVETDSCLQNCKRARCGDGILRTGLMDGESGFEECDDGNDNDNDECRNNCRVARCGDGAVHADVEACDDGNGIETDDCLNNCQLATCGDGVIQANVETCDDQNSDDTDACTNLCQRARCGDGVVFAGNEACDDGNLVSTDACLNDCTVARCGDGHVHVGVEDCDDGNDDDEDGCRSDCTGAFCGDGFVQAGEGCDDGNDVDTDGCRNDCTEARCGDGVINEGVEECDDGNNDETDACTNTCAVATCGDGIVRTDVASDDSNYEVCDDGNDVDEDACPTTCERARCGDGFVQAGVEECDDANDANDDGCVERVVGGTVQGCFAATCGDGYVNLTPIQGADGVEGQPTELCDDGNRENGDDCPTTCIPARCGDAFVRTIAENPDDIEECDDGNNIETDACRNGCVRASCGDGIIWAGVEECDDANSNNRDGCVKICLDEAPPGGLEDGLPRDGDCVSFACRLARCGDGIRRTDLIEGTEGYEACDDGDGDDRDGCTNACQQARCGDGIRRDDVAFGSREFEACDDGNDNNNDNCLNTCAFAACGDGVVNSSLRNGRPTEECDDGNDIDIDGCTKTCRTAVCGDGLHRQDLQPDEEGYEACDDGNDADDDSCLVGCILARCGDGVVNRTRNADGVPIEVCDDGNRLDNDHCRANCQPNICGDGIVNEALVEPNDGTLPYPVEHCDDANDSDFDGCLTDCTRARCGDGIRRTDVSVGEPGYEACDDGNDDKTDGCLVVLDEAGQSSCIRAVCGDGVRRLDVSLGSPGYEPCDDGNDANDDGCLRRCILASDGATLVDGVAIGGACLAWQCALAECGDGIRRRDLSIGQEGYEFCDDGNALNTDVCLSSCEPATCGDGFVLDGLEECDDKNTNDNDDCRNDCTAAYCGDGVKAGTEACDDGNQLDDDDCVNCVLARCGDGVLRQYSEDPLLNEECDYNQVGMAPTQCLNSCRFNVCGDGVTYEGVEECDDGANGQTNDGCMDNCVAAYCGDGLLYDGVEQCDDGNIINGDGCESDCTTCSATYFDGDDYAFVEQPGNLGLLQPPFTVEYWMQWTKGDEQAPRIVTVLAYGNSGDVFQFRVDQRNDLIYFENDDAANGPNGAILDNQWHHIAATRQERANGYRDVLFVDGKEVDAQNYDGQVPFRFQNPLFLGADSAGAGAFHFTGHLRQLRISNEILYTGPFTPQWRYDRLQNANTWPLTDAVDGLSAAQPINDTSAPPDIDIRFEGASIRPVACGLGLCGDGRLDVAEQCDDGNLDNLDGCNDVCETQCASLSFNRGSGWFTHESLGDLLDGATEGSMEVWVAPDSLPEVPVTLVGTTCDGPRVDLLTDGRLRLAVGESTCTTSQPVFAGDAKFRHVALNFQASTPYAKAYLDGERICDLEGEPVVMDLQSAGVIAFGSNLTGCPMSGIEADVEGSMAGLMGPARVMNVQTDSGGRAVVAPEFSAGPNILFAVNHHEPIQNGIIRSLDADARVSRILAARRVLVGPACGTCGDGIPQADEACDDGNVSNLDGCLNSCELPRCGDGFLRRPDESCDDGNLDSGDGCDAQCQRETVEWISAPAELPAARAASQVAHDGLGLVVVGGDGPDDCIGSPQTAVYEQGLRWMNGTWVELPMENGPSPVADGIFVFDPSSGRTVMFGGYNRCTQSYSSDTRLWDGVRWTVHIKPTPAALTGRAGMAAIYDPANERIVMYGGHNEQTVFSETWTWTHEAGWVQIFGDRHPGARHGASLGIDPDDQSLILFGGATDDVTWRFAGDAWSSVVTTSQPTQRSGSRMVLDPVRHELVLFGGHVPGESEQFLGDTWIWADGGWTQEMDAGGTVPSARSHFGWEYDPLLGRVVFIGGQTLTGPSAAVFSRQ